jgi:hypothetical protein
MAMYSYAFELILLKIITRGRVHWFCMKVLKATEFLLCSRYRALENDYVKNFAEYEFSTDSLL